MSLNDIHVKYIKKNLSVDFILCRNLLHFFTDQQLEQFFILLKKILKPQGQVIFTVNSTYFPDFKDIFNNETKITRFSLEQFLLTDFSKGTLPCYSFYKNMSICHQDLDPLTYTQTITHLKQKGKPWHITPEYNKLDNNTKRSIITSIIKPKNQQAQDSVNEGCLLLCKNTLWAYSLENLSILFTTNGFVVDKTFLVNNRTGYIFPNDSSSGEKFAQMGMQVGVIAKR